MKKRRELEEEKEKKEEGFSMFFGTHSIKASRERDNEACCTATERNQQSVPFSLFEK